MVFFDGCSVPGCDGDHYARTLCKKHYQYSRVNNLPWPERIIPATVTQERVRIERIMVAALRSALPTSLTVKMLCERSKIGRDLAQEALASLVAQGKIQRSYAGYRAIPEDVSAFDHLRRTKGTRWMDDASCKGMDPETFYSTPGKEEPHPDAVCACNECPVADECLLAQLSWEASHYKGCARHNYYGGTTPAERGKLARNPGLLAIRIMAHRERLKEKAA